MLYQIVETLEARRDIRQFIKYILEHFHSEQAAMHLIEMYDREIDSLKMFPLGYRGIGIEHRGYEIRMKPFDSYNLFFVVNEERKEVVILRILKDRQNWNVILRVQTTYRI